MVVGGVALVKVMLILTVVLVDWAAAVVVPGLTVLLKVLTVPTIPVVGGVDQETR